MIKRLFFAALLLLPGVAYAGNPSADLSVQVVDPSAGSGPAAPTPAVAAGFTTCVVCFDWTAASGGVYVNGAAVPGVNASQPNTWLDCAGASSPIWYFLDSSHSGVDSFPCPSITTDTSGTQVLVQTAPAGSTAANSQWFNSSMELAKSGNGIAVPTNGYMEATFEVPQFPYGSASGTGTYIEGPWLGGGDGNIPGAYNGLEFDAFEVNHDTNPGAFAAGMGNWYGGIVCPTNCDNWYGTYPPNYNGSLITSQYVKVGERITSDGSAKLYKCMWINDVFQNCTYVTAGAGSISASQLGDATSRMGVYLAFAGVYCNSCGSYTTSSPMVAWIKGFNYWSCANWQTTACSTPGNADPGGY